MKKRLSVLMLAARFTIYRVILLLLGMSIVQIGMFLLVLEKGDANSPEVLLTISNCGIAAVIGFVLLCVLLGKSVNGSGGAMSAYTVDRLSVNELEFTGWFAAYNSLMFLAFWMWEALTMLFMCLIYVWQAPQEAVGPQTIFLTCYRMGYLHQLIPLADISGWVRNIAFVLAMGICTATSAYHERSGRRAAAVWFMAVGVIEGVSEMRGSGDGFDVIFILWSILVTAVTVGVVISKEREFGKGGDRWVSGN